MSANRKQVMLVDSKGRKHLVCVGEGTIKVGGLGVVDTDKLAKAAPGQRLEIAGEPYILLEPGITDHLSRLSRGAQIILPKDGAHIVIECGIISGSKVLEIGAGSGSLTMMLAAAVLPDGKVTSYEREPKSAKMVQKNLEKAGLDAYVNLIEGDGGSCTDSDVYDAVITDLPEPWKLIDVIEKALKPGGHFCAYVPSMNQVEATVKCMRERNFFDIHAQETLLRNIVVGDKGTRPDYQMLGHTGYLCFGRFLG